MFPDAIQSAGCHVESPTWLRIGLPGESLFFPRVSTHLTQCSRMGVLQIPSAKEIWLVGTRRLAFSAVAPTLCNIFPLKIRMTPTLLAFHKALKPDCEPGELNVLNTLFHGFIINRPSISYTVPIYFR